MTELLAQLEAMYGAGKYCPKGPESCRNIDQLVGVIAKSRNYDELTEAWKGWHDDRAAACARTTRASSSSPTKARASWASRTSA